MSFNVTNSDNDSISKTEARKGHYQICFLWKKLKCTRYLNYNAYIYFKNL